MIREVRLRNFKCFGELDLPLAPLTLLSGINSTGKSTVLQALLLLRQSHLSDQLDRSGLALNGQLVRLGTAAATLREGAARLELGIDWDDGATAAFGFDLKSAGSSGEKASSEPDRDAYELALATGPAREVYETRTPFTNCRYVSADRMGPRASFPTSDALVRGGDIGARGEFAAHYLARYGGHPIRVDALHHENASRTLRSEVDAWLGMLSPDVQVVADLHADLDVCKLAFTFPGAAGRTNEQRSTHVGFGLTYVLPILVAILSAEPGDLVMIENPEAHIHPRAQRQITELLARAASAGIQVIVETHSDHVLNAARVAVKTGALKTDQVRIHFFTQDGMSRRMISPMIHADGSIHEWPEGFFDEWDRALEELLAR